MHFFPKRSLAEVNPKKTDVSFGASGVFLVLINLWEKVGLSLVSFVWFQTEAGQRHEIPAVCKPNKDTTNQRFA